MMPWILFAIAASSMVEPNELIVYPPSIVVSADRPALFMLRGINASGRETPWTKPVDISIRDPSIALVRDETIFVMLSTYAVASFTLSSNVFAWAKFWKCIFGKHYQI